MRRGLEDPAARADGVPMGPDLGADRTRRRLRTTTALIVAVPLVVLAAAAAASIAAAFLWAPGAGVVAALLGGAALGFGSESLRIESRTTARRPGAPTGRDDEPDLWRLVDRVAAALALPAPRALWIGLENDVELTGPRDADAVLRIGLPWLVAPRPELERAVAFALVARRIGAHGPAADRLAARVERARAGATWPLVGPLHAPFATWAERRQDAVLGHARATARAAVATALGGPEPSPPPPARDPARFADYWVSSVSPCLDDGFAPPVLEGWTTLSRDPVEDEDDDGEDRGEETDDATEDEHGVPFARRRRVAFDVVRLHGSQRDVERRVLRALMPDEAPALVDIAWDRVADAVWAPRLRTALLAWERAGAPAPFAIADYRDAVLHDLDRPGWPELATIGLVLTLVDEGGWSLEAPLEGPLWVSGGGWSLQPQGLGESVLDDAWDEDGWEQLVEDAGVAELVVRPGAAQRRPSVPDRWPDDDLGPGPDGSPWTVDPRPDHPATRGADAGSGEVGPVGGGDASPPEPGPDLPAPAVGFAAGPVGRPREARAPGTPEPSPDEVLTIALVRPSGRLWRTAAAGVLLLLLVATSVLLVVASARADTAWQTVSAVLVAVAVPAGVAAWLLPRLRARLSNGSLVVVGDTVVVRHPGVLREPLELPRHAIRAVLFDDGDWSDDRRFPIGATERLVVSGRSEAAGWLWTREDPTLVPMVGHGSEAPNLALLLDGAPTAPRTRRIASWGPIPGEVLSGLLVAVQDVDAARRAFAPWALGRAATNDDLRRVGLAFLDGETDGTGTLGEDELLGGAPVSTGGAPRRTLLRARELRKGWLLLAAGVLVPFLALWAVGIGLLWRIRDGRGQLPLILGGLAIFVARLAFWLG